jgi:hypothetical protein
LRRSWLGRAHEEFWLAYFARDSDGVLSIGGPTGLVDKDGNVYKLDDSGKRLAADPKPDSVSSRRWAEIAANSGAGASFSGKVSGIK